MLIAVGTTAWWRRGALLEVGILTGVAASFVATWLVVFITR